jgi:hypothetical protein
MADYETSSYSCVAIYRTNEWWLRPDAMVIVEPHEVQLANLILLDELYDDISSCWYRIAQLDNDATEMITIDLSEQRLAFVKGSAFSQRGLRWSGIINPRLPARWRASTAPRATRRARRR